MICSVPLIHPGMKHLIVVMSGSRPGLTQCSAASALGWPHLICFMNIWLNLMEDALSHSGSLSLSLSRALFRHVLCSWSWSWSSLINKTFIHAWVSAVNPVARNPPSLSANWHFRSASILLVTPQLPKIQSILEGRNQVPPSHFRCRFTRIYITVEKKRQSQLPFHADFKLSNRSRDTLMSYTDHSAHNFIFSLYILYH